MISLAVATALKITPVVFGVLLLYNRQFKEAVRAVIYGALIGFLPFLFFEGGFSNVTQMIENIKQNIASYGDSSMSECTFWTCFSSYTETVFERPFVSKVGLKWLTYLISLVLLASAFFHKNKWESVLAVTLFVVILPSHSGYYNILYLIPAIICFLNAEEHKLSDLFVLAAVLIIIFVFRLDGKMGNVLNYQLGLIVLTVFCFVRGIICIGQSGIFDGIIEQIKKQVDRT